jgi:hypothetical protein
MRREYRRAALVLEVPHQRPGFAARDRVEAGGRLVEEDQVGVADDADRDVEPALLAARERGGLLPGLLGQPDHLDDLVDGERIGVEGGEVPEDLAYRQVGEGAATLRYHADAGAPGAVVAGRVLPEHAYLAAGGRAGTDQNLDGRRLASSIRPEQCEDLTTVHLEVDPP